MANKQIIGIVLVRNEDIFLERAIRNISEFCDKIIITDHESEDKTPEIARNLAKNDSRISYKRIAHPKESHEVIEQFAGTDTWIFAVDGDEIYDPEGLMRFRKTLTAGSYDNAWCIKGNVLNCTSIDYTGKTARGYLSPPTRSMTKLFNFSIINRWTDCPQRIHAGNLEFKKHIAEPLTLELFKTVPWENADFRCLHTAFMQRSSLEKRTLTNSRPNPSETLSAAKARNNKAYIRFIRKYLKSFVRLDWKNKKYKDGPLVEKDISVFLL